MDDNKEQKLLNEEHKSDVNNITMGDDERKNEIIPVKMPTHDTQEQKEKIAELHSKTYIMMTGDGNKEKCTCCQRPIGTEIDSELKLKSEFLLKYGLDIVNFNTLLKKLIIFMKYIWIIFIVKLIISILFNISDFKNLKFPVNFFLIDILCVQMFKKIVLIELVFYIFYFVTFLILMLVL